MITVYCGEDMQSSRLSYANCRNDYIQQGYTIFPIDATQISDLLSWQSENIGLFDTKRVFFTDHINKLTIRKRGKKTISKTKTYEDVIIEIAKNSQIELIDWEEKSARELKLGEHVLIKESKLPTSIFKLQDACVPGNKESFVGLLRKVAENSDEQFIFIMLARYIKSLILASEDALPKTVFAWQAAKMKKQASMWKKEHLIQMYEGMFRLDLSTKTGTNAYGILKSLEILACHYL